MNLSAVKLIVEVDMSDPLIPKTINFKVEDLAHLTVLMLVDGVRSGVPGSDNEGATIYDVIDGIKKDLVGKFTKEPTDMGLHRVQGALQFADCLTEVIMTARDVGQRIRKQA